VVKSDRTPGECVFVRLVSAIYVLPVTRLKLIQFIFFLIMVMVSDVVAGVTV
jgi:hypothetical protein